MFFLQNCKAYAKKSIQYLPPIGWMWKFSEFVFLERSFEKDKEIIMKQISEIGDYPDPVWVCQWHSIKHNDFITVCVLRLIICN